MKPLVVLALAFVSLLLTGCSETKEEAIEAAAEIRTLCKEKKNDQANAKGLEMYEKNVVFRIGVEESAAIWKTKDIANYNYCGAAFVTGQEKIAKAEDPEEGCSCDVPGAQNRSRRTAWWLLGALGLFLYRRRLRG